MPEAPNTIIHIDWSGPHTFEDVVKCNGHEDFGIYQIYGSHHVYGSDVLLYIGLAADQTFAERLPDHSEWCLGTPDPKQVKYYLGRLFDYATPDNNEWCRRLKLAERLLIRVHLPAMNTQKKLANFEKELEAVHVANWRNYRDLLPEVTGIRWTGRFEDLSCDQHYSTEHFKKT